MTPRDTLIHIESELNAAHVERPDVVRSLLLALLARQHVILLGPPGTGKSRLARDLCQRILGTFFEWQLTRFSTPEEVFGPMSLQGLEHDHYRRVTTNKLPEADIAYIDETFKGSSAILNSFLAAMNERIFYNDGQATPIPLITMVGASNELPEDREELGALWDRFLLRHVVDYVKDPTHFTQMLTGTSVPPVGTTLAAIDLAQAQLDVQQVDLSNVLGPMTSLRTSLLSQGLIVSDRRWHDSLAVIRAQAWFNGHSVAMPGDMTILQHILWSDPSTRMAIAKAVMMLISPFDQEAQDVLDDANDAYLRAMTAPDDQQLDIGRDTFHTLKDASKLLKTIEERARQAGTPSTRAIEGLAQLTTWGEEVNQKCLKI